MDIQWYPGHMAKAKRQMQENLQLVDVVIEIADARAPLSSRNPDISKMARNKPCLLLLNKSDLADEVQNKKWIEYFTDNNISCLLVDSLKRNTLKNVLPSVRAIGREKIERDARRGIQSRPIRAMVTGIPNVGKSTFINSYIGRSAAKTGNMPGVTKGKQWISLDSNILMLDTPGVLWAKFRDPDVGKKLAFIGSIKDDILNSEELVLDLIGFLIREYPGSLSGKYNVCESEDYAGILLDIGRRRGCLVKGGEISAEKAAALIFDDFRNGKLGRITLEKAGEATRFNLE